MRPTQPGGGISSAASGISSFTASAKTASISLSRAPEIAFFALPPPSNFKSRHSATNPSTLRQRRSSGSSPSSNIFETAVAMRTRSAQGTR